MFGEHLCDSVGQSQSSGMGGLEGGGVIQLGGGVLDGLGDRGLIVPGVDAPQP